MLNRMQQDGQNQMQQTFNRIMQQSIQKSGAQVDPNDVPGSLGGIIAFAMMATVEEAQKHKKQVPAQVVIQSAVDIAKQALSQFNIDEQQLDQLLSQIFTVAIQQFLAMAQDVLSPEERAKYEQFMQMVGQGMQQPEQGQQPQQQPQQQQPAQMGGM